MACGARRGKKNPCPYLVGIRYFRLSVARGPRTQILKTRGRDSPCTGVGLTGEEAHPEGCGFSVIPLTKAGN